MSDSTKELHDRAWAELRLIREQERRELGHAPYEWRSNYVRVGEYGISRGKYSMRITVKMGVQITVFDQGYTDLGRIVNSYFVPRLLKLLRERQILRDLANV